MRAAVAVALLVAGCTRFGPMRPTENDPVQLVSRADEISEHDPHTARRLYLRVARENRGRSIAGDALWGLARLHLEPQGQLRDYAAADAILARILTAYPDSRHADEARVWHAALGELLRNDAEVKRLRADLERLKALDLEQERRHR
jgi:hypothetical protein